ncbi:MAG: hypothetical protein JNL01_16745 [Bdellovibrionales bacterium]|nr:hypothetical protein [Bdellovibrionales bacterium]
MIRSILVVFALATHSAMALDLRAPFELESTKVLPKKIRNPRFKNVFTSITGRFSGDGIEQPLGQRLNKTVSWNDVINAQPTQADKDSIVGILNDAGLTDLNASPGQTSGVVNTYAQVMAPVLAYGVTDSYTLAVAVPIYTVRVDSDAGFIRAGQGQQFVDQAASVNVEKGNEAAGKLNNAIQEKLKRLGYKPIEDQTLNVLGDLRLVGKYLFYQDEIKTLTLKHEATLPTGRTPDPDNVLAIPIGDGQWDAGLSLITDVKLAPMIRLNAFGGYIAQLPATMTRRLPTSPTDSLSADKEGVIVDLGDILVGGTSVNYEVQGSPFSIGVGYQFQRMAKASVKDGVFESSRYRLLENELPVRILHSGLVMAGFSTVDMYKRKKFIAPIQANLAYSRALAGVNATTNSMLLAELVLFF